MLDTDMTNPREEMMETAAPAANPLVVKVCDAIMGSGKSQAVIRYMNEHPERKFIYVTPYLDECARIKASCPELNFVEPEALPQYGRSKLRHTLVIMESGENITTTHSAFKSYDEKMLQAIRDHHYTLIIDEALATFQDARISKGDVELLKSYGIIGQNNGGFRWKAKEYGGKKFADYQRMFNCNSLIAYSGNGQEPNYYYWSIAPAVLREFTEVIVLTYLFKYQEFRYYLDINGIPYRYIGIHRDPGEGHNVYRLVDQPDYVPEYTKHIRDKLHICDDFEKNVYGSREKALSLHWFGMHRREQDVLRKHMQTFCRGWCKAKGGEIMWSTYKVQEKWFSMPGFKTNMVAFNTKASNEYRDRFALAYMVNLYPQPQMVGYLEQQGFTYDADGYALSNMIQWIWRSAIRDGKEVWLYLPSSRMRRILNQWLDDLEAGRHPGFAEAAAAAAEPADEKAAAAADQPATAVESSAAAEQAAIATDYTVDTTSWSAVTMRYGPSIRSEMAAV